MMINELQEYFLGKGVLRYGESQKRPLFSLRQSMS